MVVRARCVLKSLGEDSRFILFDLLLEQKDFLAVKFLVTDLIESLQKLFEFLLEFPDFILFGFEVSFEFVDFLFFELVLFFLQVFVFVLQIVHCLLVLLGLFSGFLLYLGALFSERLQLLRQVLLLGLEQFEFGLEFGYGLFVLF